MRLSALAARFSLNVVRDGEFASLGFADHDRPAMLLFLESAAYLSKVQSHPRAAAVLATAELAPQVPPRLACAVAAAPGRVFYEIHNHLAAETDFYGALAPSAIAPSARVHPTAFVAPRGVVVGEHVQLGPYVVVHERSVLEDGVVVRAHSVVGGEGFQFKKYGTTVLPVAHAGRAVLRKRVELQQHCCVDRAVFGSDTELGEDSKLDNFVYIAHDVRVGKRTFIASHAGVNGSTVVGDDVWIGPHAAVSNGLTIGDGARVTIGAVVTRDVPPGQSVSGNFAIEHHKLIRFVKSLAND